MENRVGEGDPKAPAANLTRLELRYLEKKLERVKGIEPSSLAWEAKALPLSYTRKPAHAIKASMPDWLGL
jgi:hypothetical protein